MIINAQISQRRSARSRKARLVLYLIGPLASLIAVAAGCSRTPSASSPGPSAARTKTVSAEAEFVGSAACADCHPGEFKSHAKSSHSVTLHVMDADHLGSLAPPVGRIAGTGYVIGTRQGRFAIAAPGYSDVIAPLDLAFGSGRSGMTYVSVEGDTIADAQMSYFPKLKQWYLTPGHTPKPPSVLGLRYDAAFSRQCIQCHATTLPADSLMVEPKFFGVGCEACHGPGGQHISIVRGGGPGRGNIQLGADSRVDAIGRACAKCHAPRQDFADNGTAMESTHRFQSLGLAESRCFKEGGKSLTCVTCHDPHSDASKDIAGYEAVCLRCHSPSAARINRPPGAGAAGKVCPVHATTGCTKCHMPARQIFNDSNVPIRLADHLIRIFRKSRSRAASAASGSPLP
jgi:hypothetical protein